MTETPRVSIIIPVKPGGVVSALRGVRKVDYPHCSFEVLVAEGVRPSRQRNLAASASSGGILYFLDDDSQVAPHFLTVATAHFRDPAVAVVGGPSLTPDSDSVLQQAFAMVFASLFGGGGMRNRYRSIGKVRVTSDRELILCNLGFRRETFLLHGGFNERLYPNEENELLERINREGLRLVHDPGLSVFRSQRPTLKAFCRQLLSYGKGRGEQTVISGVIRPITFIPSIFLIYLLLLPMAHKAVYYIPLLCYLITVVSTSLFEWGRNGRLLPSLCLPLLFPLFHLCYGIGMIWGLCSTGRVAQQVKDEVNIHRVKDFGGEWRSGSWDQGIWSEE